jgi:predicted type IV restriction endonuclease
MADNLAKLESAIPVVRERIAKYRGSKRFNEQNTKASLILPVLEALGWNPNDPEDVQWEYKPKPRYNPVDFALLLKRTPCLFLEAKALGESLADYKLVKQILSYASMAGVQWVALSNGDEYRIYNANALVPAEEKLFRTISISSEATANVLSTLSLLSKVNLQDKKIATLWESHFVDRQVKAALEELLNPDEPAKSLVRAIKKLSDGKLRESDIRASLKRSQLQIDFPEEPETEVQLEKRPQVRRRRQTKAVVRKEDVKAKARVSLRALITEGLLKPPVEIFSHYRKRDLRATIKADGSIAFGGERYTSLSTAGGMARKPLHTGDLKGRPYPQTNGWTFWRVRDPETGEPVEIDSLRDRFLERKKSEASRFLEKA